MSKLLELELSNLITKEVENRIQQDISLLESQIRSLTDKRDALRDLKMNIGKTFASRYFLNNTKELVDKVTAENAKGKENEK